MAICRAQKSHPVPLCGQLIDVMQAAQDGFRDDLASLPKRLNRFTRAKSTLPDRSLWAPLVEVGDVLGQHTTQMALIQDQKVIQTFGPDRSNPSLRNGIGLGRSKRSTDGCDAKAVYPAIEDCPVTTIAVVYEKARRLTIPTAGFHDFPPCPLAGRMPRGSDMHDLSARVIDDEEDMDRLEKDRLDAEKVAGPGFPCVRHEKPSPTWRGPPVVDASHVFSDGPGRDLEAQSGRLRLDTLLSL